MSEKTKNQEATPSKEYEFNSYGAYNISNSSFGQVYLTTLTKTN